MITGNCIGKKRKREHFGAIERSAIQQQQQEEVVIEYFAKRNGAS
jgi:hypothetical protein